MQLFRIAHSRFLRDLSGEGARRYGGRWNSVGVAIVYTSGTQSLSMLELLTNTPLTLLPKHFGMLQLSVPDRFIKETVSVDTLPEDWRDHPPVEATRQFGNEWVKTGETLILKVPSVIVPSEFNYLINPNHKDIAKVKIETTTELDFDQRILENLIGN